MVVTGSDEFDVIGIEEVVYRQVVLMNSMIMQGTTLFLEKTLTHASIPPNLNGTRVKDACSLEKYTSAERVRSI